jgi:hypothetical protein
VTTTVAPDAPKTLDELLQVLTPKQIEFLEALPNNNWQPWKTVKACGFGLATLHRWMEIPAFVEARRVLIQRSLDAVGATHERVVMEIARVAFADVRELLGPTGEPLAPNQWGDDASAALQSVEVETRYEGRGEQAVPYTITKFKQHSKMDALKVLAMLHGKLVERVEHTGKDGGPIQTEELSDFEKARRVAFLLARGLANQDSQPGATGTPPQTTL